MAYKIGDLGLIAYSASSTRVSHDSWDSGRQPQYRRPRPWSRNLGDDWSRVFGDRLRKERTLHFA